PTYPRPTTPTVAARSWMRFSTSSFIGSFTRLSAIEGSDAAHDFIQLRVRELGIDRQRKDFARGALRLGISAGLVAEMCEARLEVQWQGVVDRAADALLLEARL